MRGGQVLQLGDRLGVTGQVQVGIDAGFQGLQPQLGYPWHLPQR